MDALIEALTIMRRYASPEHPTHCEHDVLYVMVSPSVVSGEDLARLRELHFSQDEDCFYSPYFGSC